MHRDGARITIPCPRAADRYRAGSNEARLRQILLECITKMPFETYVQVPALTPRFAEQPPPASAENVTMETARSMSNSVKIVIFFMAPPFGSGLTSPTAESLEPG